MLDLILKNARIGALEKPQDISISNGVIKTIAPNLEKSAKQVFDAEGNFVCSGFYESHIHLDKACILDRSTIEEGTLDEAVEQTSKAKEKFTKKDVLNRASTVVEMAIKKGTLALRTFVETDPKTKLESFQAIKEVREKYAFAIDIEICAFAQEGLTGDPETEELLQKALENGADLIGGCPYKDDNPDRHIETIFDLAEKYKVNADFHLDFDLDPAHSSIPKISEETKKRKYEGRVSIGHVTKLAAMSELQLQEMKKLLKEANITLTVLPATDIFLNGRDHQPLVPRGMVNANELSEMGITTTISSNNILNGFTPYGDASLIRMANMYANVAQLSQDSAVMEVHNMITKNAAKLFNVQTEIKEGSPANFVILEAKNAVEAIRTIAQALAGFKNGRQTFSNEKAQIYFNK